MLNPIAFRVEDFLSGTEERAVRAIKAEALEDGALIDNLVLLKFVELHTVQQVMRDVYKIDFVWLRMDPTPEEYKPIAEKHGVLLEKGREFIAYVPVGATVDDALLQIDIPQYKIVIKYIADCNYRMVRKGMDDSLLSMSIADFRPILVFKRLILDCMSKPGTDMHFESRYVEKKPDHVIRYRVKKKLEYSDFHIDLDMMQRIVQSVISKLTPASVMDVDSVEGVTTEVRDLFRDGTCDLRISGKRSDAGFYFVFTIQTVNTTTKKISELGFPKADADLLYEIAQRRTGLTLVTGEMRSGKNTTIFAMLNEIDTDSLRVVEYSNPIENHMSFPQFNYRGDIKVLRELIRMAKKEDIDIAVLNEIPDASVAFAVRDLVNSAVGVITTTHVDRVWHVVEKLNEFYGSDYKTIISQLNVVINHKMFLRWSCPNMQKRMLIKEHGQFEMFAYQAGVRQYFVPADASTVKRELQPLTEILVITDTMKTAMLNFDERWKSEQMLRLQIQQQHGTLENKCAAYINEGLMSLEELRKLY